MKQVEERQKPTIPRTEFFATISQLSKASHLQNSSSWMSQSCCEHGREGYVGGGFHASAPARSVRQVEIWHVQGKIPLLPHRQFPDQEEIHCHGAHLSVVHIPSVSWPPGGMRGRRIFLDLFRSHLIGSAESTKCPRSGHVRPARQWWVPFAAQALHKYENPYTNCCSHAAMYIMQFVFSACAQNGIALRLFFFCLAPFFRRCALARIVSLVTLQAAWAP